MAAGPIEQDGFQLPAGTVTLLLTDIEGSTRLWEAAPGAMGEAVARHYEILAECVATHGGVRPQEQGEGDSVVAAFSRASDALAAARGAQQALDAEAWPTPSPLLVRMAVHTGEAQLRDNANYFGQAIIRCARIRAVAHGGQTLVSNATRDLVLDVLDEQISLTDLGDHRLKDLGRPERLWQLEDPARPREFGPLRSLDAHPNNLPVQLTSFVGRVEETARVCSLVVESRLVTLTGSGGAGKTRLALQAAAELTEAFPDGVWLVELAALEDPDLVASAVASALSVDDRGGPDPVVGIAARLADRRALLAIDNCEHLADACTDLIDRLLRACRSLTVLATSRSPLEVPGEIAWRIPPMSIPDAATRPRIETLRTYDAVHLFVDRARKARSNFALDDENAPAVAAICARLEGIPLAIELAAARVRLLAPEQIASGLDDSFRLLGAGSRTVLPRQQTLEASIEWSHALLDPAERTLLRRLSVFAGGFTLDAAETVAGDEALDTYLVLDLLGRLVDRSLVVADTDTRASRFHLLETIRQYAGRRLQESEEFPAASQRHLAFYKTLAQQLIPPHDLVVADITTGAAEIDNLRAALRFASDMDGPADSWFVLAEVLSYMPTQVCRPRESSHWLEQAVASGLSPALEARALGLLTRLQLLGGDPTAAFATGEQAIALGIEVGDQATVGRVRSTLAGVLLFAQPEDARALLDQVSDCGDTFAQAQALNVRAMSWLWQDRYREALEATVDAEAPVTSLGSLPLLSQLHTIQAGILLRMGDLAAAVTLGQTAVTEADRCGDQVGATSALLTVACARILRDGSAADPTEVQDVRHIRDEIGIHETGPMVDTLEGYHRMFHDDTVGAVASFESAIDGAAAMGAPAMALYANLNLGLTEIRAGHIDRAAAQAQLLRELSGPISNEITMAGADFLDGEIAFHLGERGEAERLMHLALDSQHRGLAAIHTIITLEALGALHIDADDHEGGVRLLASASAARAHLDYGWQPSASAARIDHARATAQQILGPDDYQQAWDSGYGLDLDEAVTYARRARGERNRPSSGWDSLTPTEHQVVDLVTEGLTNPQIAERLFVSRETIKTHLNHIFTKLDVTSRAQLASQATRRES
jgi:predicted ATPase/class 3 adenylate cyclase/DNA-binding CsgD family transcriptional regulator